jgi:RND family efflux transporter MFP subunit
MESAVPSIDGRMKRIALGVAIVLLCTFGVIYLLRKLAEHRLAHQYAEQATALPIVEVVEAKPAEAPQTLSLPGETHAWYLSTIFARVDGYVANWYVDIGDHVTEGQVLADIDTPELDAQLAAARAQLRVANAQVLVWEAETAFAKANDLRWRGAAPGVVSEQEREDKKAGFRSSAAKLAAAKAQVARDQADVDHYLAFETFKHVVAPYTGTIIEREIDIGNLVSAGSTSNTTPLYRMAQDDPMRVWVDVPQSAQTDLMQAGAEATILTSQAPASRITGKIVRTAGAINPESRTFRVEDDVPNPNGILVSGMYVQVIFNLPTRGLLEVPAAAMIFRSAGPQVAVVGSDDTVQMHNVTIARDDGKTVLLGSGVTAGERVALNLSTQISGGEKVSVREAR